MKTYMAIDQWGHTHHNLKHPRKDLCEKFGVKHVQRMFCDTKAGVMHVGYIISGHWLELFEVKPYQKKVR